MNFATLVILAAATVLGGPWTVETKKDDFTDAVSSKASARGRSGELFLLVMCDKDGRLDLAVGTEKQRFGGRYMTGGVRSVSLDLRVDELPPVSTSIFSQAYLGFFMGASEGDKTKILQQIRTARSKIRIRAEGPSGVFINDEISAIGSAKAIGAVEATCA